jgi:hypothetical protein
MTTLTVLQNGTVNGVGLVPINGGFSVTSLTLMIDGGYDFASVPLPSQTAFNVFDASIENPNPNVPNCVWDGGKCGCNRLNVLTTFPSPQEVQQNSGTICPFQVGSFYNCSHGSQCAAPTSLTPVPCNANE